MTIIELGALGEFLGAIAVVLTLIYLSVQVRHSRELLEANRASMEESTRLARVAAMDRHSDAVSRWRGRLIEDPEVLELWQTAIADQDLDKVAEMRLENLFVDWINTYRSLFKHAKSVGDSGLARQAVLTVCGPLGQSRTLQAYWEWARPINELAALDFVTEVEAEAEPQLESPAHAGSRSMSRAEGSHGN